MDGLGNSDSIAVMVRLEAEPPAVPTVVIISTSRTATPTATAQTLPHSQITLGGAKFASGVMGGSGPTPTVRPTTTNGSVTFGSVAEDGEVAPQAEGSPNLLWGLGALGLIGAVTAAVLEERGKRKEEEARQLAEAQAKAAALNAAEEQKRIQNWMNGNIILNQKLDDLQKAGTSLEVITVVRNVAMQSGLGTAMDVANLLQAAVIDINYIDNGSGSPSLHDLLLQQATTDWGRNYGVSYAENGWNMLANAQSYYIWAADTLGHEGEDMGNFPMTDESLLYMDPQIKARFQNAGLTPIVCADVPRISYSDINFNNDVFNHWYIDAGYSDVSAPHNSVVIRHLVNAQGNLHILDDGSMIDIGDMVFSPGGLHEGLIIFVGSDHSTTLVLQTSISQGRLNVMTLENWENVMYDFPEQNTQYVVYNNYVTYGHVDSSTPTSEDTQMIMPSR